MAHLLSHCKVYYLSNYLAIVMCIIYPINIITYWNALPIYYI